MKSIKNKSTEFLKKFKMTVVNAPSLISAIEKQGYSVVEYSRISNSSDVESLLVALNVKSLSLTTGAFTYADKNHRILFIEEGLSDDEKTILLAHEEGHIFLGHLNSMNGICGDEILKEHEANTFAHYLLNRSFLNSLYVNMSVYKLRTALISMFVLILLGASVTAGIIYNKNLHKNEYCRTRAGWHYHLPDCETIENFEVTYDSRENYEKIGIDPCKVCLPDLAKQR
jgi:hypothetical protein